MSKIRGLRWWMMSLIMLGSIINYLTRNVLSFAAPTILHNLHIGAKEYGWIQSAFQGTLMLQPLAGYALDVLGLKIGLAIFVTTWALVNMAHAGAGSWQMLAGLRGLLGLAEGSANPAGMKATAEWFPAKERGFAGGVYNIGASVGSMVAGPLVGWTIYHYHSWQAAFLITGGLGLFWVGLWLCFYHPMDRHPKLSDGERNHILGGQEKRLQGDGRRPSIAGILGLRNFWGIALPRFLADPTWGMLTAWVPLYFSTVRHWDIKHLAAFTWLPFLAADIGCMCGGTIAATLQKYGHVSLINARRGAFTCGALMMTCMAFVGYVKDPYAALALLCLGGFAHQTLSVTCITMASDLFKRNEVATVAGMAGTCGNGGILVFNLVMAPLLAVIGYTPFFVCLGVLDLLGATILWTVVREPAPETPAVP